MTSLKQTMHLFHSSHAILFSGSPSICFPSPPTETNVTHTHTHTQRGREGGSRGKGDTRYVLCKDEEVMNLRVSMSWTQEEFEWGY